MENDIEVVDDIEIVDAVEVVDDVEVVSDIEVDGESIDSPSLDDFNFENKFGFGSSDGEVIKGNLADDLDDLDIDIAFEEVTVGGLAYAQTMNNSNSKRIERENVLSISRPNIDFSSISSRVNKFNSLVYLSRKKSTSIEKEMSALRNEVVEAYKEALKSSPMVKDATNERIYQDITTNVNGIFKIIIGNTIYQYRVKHSSVDNICDSLCWRLAFRSSGADEREIRYISKTYFIDRYNSYKFHVTILVPLIIDKLVGSWCAKELDEYNDILALLVGTLFNTNTVESLQEYYQKDAKTAFDFNSNSETLDKEYRDVVIGAIEELEEIYNKSEFGNSESLFVEIIRTASVENDTLNHRISVNPSLIGLLGSANLVDIFGSSEITTKFSEILKRKIAEYAKLLSDKYNAKSLNSISGISPEEILNRPYLSSLIRSNIMEGSKLSKDLVIPELFNRWRTIYENPFNDNEHVTYFLRLYKLFDDARFTGNVGNLDELSAMDDEYFKNWFLESLSQSEFNKVFNYLTSVLYSKSPTVVILEYSQFLDEIKYNLGIDSLLENEKYFNAISSSMPEGTKMPNMYKAVDYLDKCVEFIGDIKLNSSTNRYCIDCSCSGIVEVTDKGVSKSDLEVNDLLTTIRINNSKSGNAVPFDLPSSVEVCLNNLSKSGSYNEVGNTFDLSDSVFFVNQSFIKCKCGKIHLFTQGMYMALDLCAHKFMSERKNVKPSNFIQRCHLSYGYLMDSANELYNYFEATGRSYDDSLLKLPDIVEESDISEDTEDNDYSEFDRLADEFISMLSIDKDKYMYESELELAKEMNTEFSNGSAITNIEDLMNKNSEVTNKLSSVDELNNKYYNNFIWYLLKNNLKVDLDKEDILKHKISEIYGKDKIERVMILYSKMKELLLSIGEYQYNIIRNLDESNLFDALDLGFEPVTLDNKLPELGDTLKTKLIYKYINLARKASLNSSDENEFLSNLENIRIDGEQLSKCSDVLLEEFRGEKNFSFDNQSLTSGLNKLLFNDTVSIHELNNSYEQYLTEIVQLIKSEDIYRAENFYDCSFLDFELNDFLVILGSVFMGTPDSQGTKAEEFVNVISKYEDVIMDRLTNKFENVSEEAIMYFNYLTSFMDYNFEFEELKGSDIFNNLIRNLCLIRRGFVEWDNSPLDSFDKFRSSCVVNIEHNACCCFLKEVTEMCFSNAVNIILDSIEGNFREFAFRVIKVVPVDLYSSSLLNSAVGKGINDITKKLGVGLSEEDYKKALSASFGHPKLYPKLKDCSRIFNSIGNSFSENNYEFMVVDDKGNILGGKAEEDELVHKVSLIIYELFMLMDMKFCNKSNASYTDNIFKAFGMVFNLPEHLLSKGLRDEFQTTNLKIKIDYDFIKNNLDVLCNSPLVIDCCEGKGKISYHIENNQLFELYNCGRLAVDTSVVSYFAINGIIDSTIS